MSNLDFAHPDQPDPDAAFDLAIAAGRLSADETAPNYAGFYMFMYADKTGKCMFKHRFTREYLP